MILCKLLGFAYLTIRSLVENRMRPSVFLLETMHKGHNVSNWIRDATPWIRPNKSQGKPEYRDETSQLNSKRQEI